MDQKRRLYVDNKNLYTFLRRQRGMLPTEIQVGKQSTFFGMLSEKKYREYSIKRAENLNKHLFYLVKNDPMLRDESITYWVTVGLFVVLLAITAYICVKFF